jgi:hypothetical protein
MHWRKTERLMPAAWQPWLIVIALWVLAIWWFWWAIYAIDETRRSAESGAAFILVGHAFCSHGGGGLFTMGAGMATMEWGLGYATGGTAIITAGLAAFLFILGGNKAEALTDREGKW